jgi:hypothetical protein
MERDKLITIGIVAVFVISIIWIAFGAHPGEKEASVPDSAEVPAGEVYKNQELGFEITLPEGFNFNKAYVNEDPQTGKSIHGVEFIIPPQLAKGTNLSLDSHIAVEKLTGAACDPSVFIPGITEFEVVSLEGRSYDFALKTGAAAGNRYEESVYVTEDKGNCYALRYLLHSTNIGAYDPGTVREFEREDILSLFDEIASTFKIY